MISENQYFLNGKINEECGVFGVYNVSEASSICYYGLHALQHRGQQAAGIANSDLKYITCYKSKGLLNDIFNTENISEMKGSLALGHVRYSNNSSDDIENVQPIMVRAHTGEFSIVHNGSIVNGNELKIELENQGSIFQSTTDSEIIGHLIQRAPGTFTEKIKHAASQLEGAFAFIIMTKDCMFAIRDKYGLRPLSIAKLENGYVFSSETCAFDIVNATFFQDVKPGEIVKIDEEGMSFHQYAKSEGYHMCAMEYIYFSRPDSNIDGINVHTARRICGQALALEEDVEADIVIGVPDSSLSAAIGFAEISKLPYELGLIKNRYVGRTFIQPTQKQRERGVKMKLSAVTSIVKNKRVFMIDDSIVRGTTSKRIVSLLKDAGASEVHVRIASPEFKCPCFYGVDTTSCDQLISSKLIIEEVRDYIGADSLKYLSITQLQNAIGNRNMCVACFGGKYPTNLFSLQQVLEETK